MTPRTLFQVLEESAAKFGAAVALHQPVQEGGRRKYQTYTWREYRDKLSLRDNAYDPRDNILAGSAYLRDLYDRYGWPGAAAAYHAGPQRYEEHLHHAKPLPTSTVDYLTRIDRLMVSTHRSTDEQTLIGTEKPNTLFIELRRRNPSTQPTQIDSPHVQTP